VEKTQDNINIIVFRYDTTKPSAAFGGTFVVLLCVEPIIVYTEYNVNEGYLGI
jgi:hypothetical protein